MDEALEPSALRVETLEAQGYPVHADLESECQALNCETRSIGILRAGRKAHTGSVAEDWRLSSAARFRLIYAIGRITSVSTAGIFGFGIQSAGQKVHGYQGATMPRAEVRVIDRAGNPETHTCEAETLGELQRMCALEEQRHRNRGAQRVDVKQVDPVPEKADAAH